MAEAMFHVKHEGPALAVDDVQQELLRRFEDLLRTRAVAGGMVSVEDAPRLWERHIQDSLRGAELVDAGDRDAYDVGSGAGLPGVVVAIARPHLSVVLVERRRSRASFLELVVDELRLTNAVVIAAGSDVLTEAVDLVFARAVAPAAPAWAIAEPLLRPSGRLVYFAGTGFRPERDLPEGVQATVLRPLAPSGPLVIMARQ